MSPVALDELVQAALRAAAELGRDVADVPAGVIAEYAGMSRSTLLRRLGGSRAALDEAVRAAGVDPGGRSVRERAVRAAAELIGETGLAAATLEGIAARAGCAVESLYAVFGNRDTLLAATFDAYGPLGDIGDVLAAGHADLAATVLAIYRKVAEVLTREPRVAPAIFAELMARPTSPAVRTLVQQKAPQLFAVIGRWLTDEVRAGRLRDVPLPLLMHQLLAPLAVSMLMRPSLTELPFVDVPDVDRACEVFADAFLRAASTNPPPARP